MVLPEWGAALRKGSRSNDALFTVPTCGRGDCDRRLGIGVVYARAHG